MIRNCKKSLNKMTSTLKPSSDPEAIKNTVDVCIERFGLPDIVINTAAGNFFHQHKSCLQIPGKQFICNLGYWQTLEKGKKSLQFFSYCYSVC